MENQEFKPNKSSFVYYPVAIRSALVLLVLACVGMASLAFEFPWLQALAAVGGLGALTTAWMLFVRLKIYQKTAFIVQSDRIIAKGGGLIAEYEKELLFTNITHLSVSLPFIEYQIFKSGTVNIQAAGGSEVEIHFDSIDTPKDMFDLVEDKMRQNGFALSSSDRARHDRPHQFLVVFNTLVGVIISQALVLYYAVDGIVEATEQSIYDQHPAVYALILIVEFFILSGSLIPLGAGLSCRYSLFKDRCEKEVDFFFYRKTVIPIENLSDSVLNQGVLERLLGAHNLSISCQGGGQEISFAAVRNGDAWKADLDRFSQAHTPPPIEKVFDADQSQSSEPVSAESERPSLVRQKSERDKDTTSTEVFKMEPRKLFLPPLVFLGFAGVAAILSLTVFATAGVESSKAIGFGTALGAFAIIVGLSGLVQLIRNTALNITNFYEIKPVSLSRTFRFFVSNHVEFQTEKITALIVKRTLVDRLLGTCSIHFWSIGASQSLRFDHIDYNEKRIQTLLSKLGMSGDMHAPHKHIQPEAKPIDILMRFAFVLVPLVAAAVAAGILTGTLHFVLPGLVVVLIWHFVLAILRARFEAFRFFEEKIQYNRGIFNLTEFHTLYDDVKFIESVRYPGLNSGALYIEVAGEMTYQGQHGSRSVSCGFVVPYLQNVDGVHDVSDALLLSEMKVDVLPQDLADFSKPERQVYADERVNMLQVFCVFMLPITVLSFGGIIGILLFGEELDAAAYTPLIIGAIALIYASYMVFVVLYSKTIRYVIDDQKVVRQRGLFFKRRLGIHYEDIDFIGMHQGVLSKMFSTGDLTINTVGSSQTDLTLWAMPGFRSFYGVLKNDFKIGDKGQRTLPAKS